MRVTHAVTPPITRLTQPILRESTRFGGWIRRATAEVRTLTDMELRGVGVGRGVVVATVLNMPDALPEPVVGAHGTDADLELAGFSDAVEAVAAPRDARAA